ncbi:hypothetical protein LSCM1_02138 [Leishmania martiniquensis]|uniref:Uncharacterized protein n=1 Tax=Leishmania martiniquensis TaxID=1580590 RepID=A0A836H1B7_9TRYP|nr:hypothetical protein LSCM1_02138 [Leishmania martiniquensis]
MDFLGYRRFNRYGDEADGAAYMENDPYYVSPSAESVVCNSGNDEGGTYDSHHIASGGSIKRGLLSMQLVMDMTESLQKEQDDQEALAEADSANEAERMRQVRNARWEAVKACMSRRATPMPTARANDSEYAEEAVELTPVSTKQSTLNALVPSSSEEHAMPRGPLQVVETVPERLCHFVYNWFMYVVYALSASALPGMDVHKGADSREYFDRRVS